MTNAHVDLWTVRSAVTLRRLSAQPISLFLVLLILNAVARPYANFAHDARLYAFQVLNRLHPGTFADDLFLRYGSQDRYSVFSFVATPLVRALGLDWTFLALYMVFNALFILALLRFVRALVDDPIASTLALLFLVVAPTPYGGLHVFHVHEPFFTPRIIATALVLFGLEQVLRRRLFVGLALIALGGPMHPLMAFGGLMVWAGCVAAEHMRAAHLAVLGALGGSIALAVLTTESLGVQLFGGMDSAWLQLVHDATPYNFPASWAIKDWVDVAVSLVVLVGSATMLYRVEPRRGRFVCVVAVMVVVGVASTAIASAAPYALVFQGQPYRVLWIAKTIQAPLAFLLASHLARGYASRGPAAAVLLVAYFVFTDFLLWEFCAPALFFLVVAVLFRGLRPTARCQQWLWHSLAVSLLLGAIAWSLLKLCVLVAERETLLPQLDVLDYVRTIIYLVGPVVWVTLALGCLNRFSKAGAPRPSVLVPCLSVLLALQVGGVLVPHIPALRPALAGAAEDLAFSRRYLDDRWPASAAPPTVYGSWGRIDYLWITLRTKSYFDWAQLVGAMFNRETAIEGHRRAQLAGPFEVERFRRQQRFVPETTRLAISNLFGARLAGPGPTREDLVRLCGAGEPVDIAILPIEFAGLYSAQNGRVFIYDCPHVRRVLAGSAGGGGIASYGLASR